VTTAAPILPRVATRPDRSEVPCPDRPALDSESREWLRQLQGGGAGRDAAIARLHALLVRAAAFEVSRRRASLPQVRGNDLDDLANQAADDALVSVLRRLDQFRGASRFTTWAYKFALLEAAVRLRKLAWQGRELPLEPEAWATVSSTSMAPPDRAEHGEMFELVQRGIAERLTPHQRTVIVALALNDVPIDVLADRMGTTRGALYKTLHDARRKLRTYLAEQGHDPRSPSEVAT